MNYRVLPNDEFDRDLAKLNARTQERVLRRALRLVSDPRGAGTKQLQGASGERSARVGDYRILYEIDEDEQVVYLTAVDLRDRIYRRIR